MCDGLLGCASLSLLVGFGVTALLQPAVTLALWDHLLQTDDETWLRARTKRKEWKAWFGIALVTVPWGVSHVVAVCYLLGPARRLRNSVPEAASVRRSLYVVGGGWLLALFALNSGPIVWTLFDQSRQNFPPHLIVSWIGATLYGGLVVMATGRAPEEHPRSFVPVIGAGLFVVCAFWLNSAYNFCRYRPENSAICGWTGWVWAPAIALVATVTAVALALALVKLVGARQPVASLLRTTSNRGRH